ncbi:MerR family transcriptional regulator [Salipaludibacillus agaradhaerens]|uniref:MerR family transcriptional regulator n=1 Tax=Salipaludibacillus agaradhaerens TaxID=76935 RepID=UPI002151C3BB|nr:MerR family transcriptional regulator [Salipaludibacillus agaradhaerens]MCR6105680.1 MerR family transcriptional regulator [Salipaludibacillus agaradhaerens]MCR6117717.1 MerR family transcriptional regulator [Salipaludibacillus agaradhaerens]
MAYTIKKLSTLAGVTTRTLRYYDEIGLLKPARTNPSGYRLYEQAEVDKLQQILFYKELGMELERIIAILNDPTFDATHALKEHRVKLLEKREQLDVLIANVTKTLDTKEGKKMMSDNEKFDGFKKTLIDENEQAYGKEIREKYGDDTINQANAKLQHMTEEDYETVTNLAEHIHEILAEALQLGDPSSDLAQKAADLHRQWLSFYWSDYSKEAHASLAQMYVEDDRFRAYYDKEQEGVAELLRDAIYIYTGMKK